MISYNLAGKTALVTGGASGIGFATARMLAKFGATVAVNHLVDDPRGPEAVDRINTEASASGLVPGGGKAIGAPGSVGEKGNAERMVLKAVSDLGRLDLLVNNAGTPGTRRRISPPELDLITEDLWSQLLETNLLGVFRCAKAAAPALKAANGAIVNTASIAGLGRAGSSLAYSATKAGVVSLTQNLARALAPEVRVNAIAPGAVDSSWMVEWSNEERQQSIERALLKRRCQPEDLAEVIVFLGFGAAMVTGQTVTVDGGLTL
jgi:3-oxoacyl-[acyl-carrier protein] reductase